MMKPPKAGVFKNFDPSFPAVPYVDDKLPKFTIAQNEY